MNDRTASALSLLATGLLAVAGVLAVSTAIEGSPDVIPALSAGVGAIVGILLVRRFS